MYQMDQLSAACGHPDPAEQVAGRLDAQAPVTRALGLLSEPDAEVLRLWAWEHLEPRGHRDRSTNPSDDLIIAPR